MFVDSSVGALVLFPVLVLVLSWSYVMAFRLALSFLTDGSRVPRLCYPKL